MPDPTVIAALKAAVDRDPANAALRAHLASLLLEADLPDEAWEQAMTGFAAAPDDLGLLDTLVDAGERTGRDVTAYERIRSALRGSTPAAPTPDGEAAWREGVPDTADELLESWESTSPADEPEIGLAGRPTVTFSDVGGLDDVKRRIEQSFLAPLRNPELQMAFGKAAGGGLLLWGPPGCGKTFIARALAGEMGAAFYEIGLNEVLDMWLGNSERNLSSVFEYARRNTPCVLFFDELDALGQRRSQLRGSALRTVVNQLLSEMDGASKNNAGIFFLAATNHPWDVDAALLRPGRFDRKLLVLPPDRPARAAIFEMHLRDRPIANLDYSKLAKAADGLTGADIRLVCDQATESALERSIDSGSIESIRQRDVESALAATRTTIGPWLDVARNYATYSNDSGEYDDLLAYLKRHRR